ncbi:MAG: glutaredoxin-like protein NrdH [Propioniciclava sp.]
MTQLTAPAPSADVDASIRVYSKPACVQCTATYRAMDKLGLDYEVIDLAEDEDALIEVLAMGYQQVPVVVTDADHWSGFRPDLIKAAGERINVA